MLAWRAPALQSANERLPEGRENLVALANTRMPGTFLGSHLSFLLTRRAWMTCLNAACTTSFFGGISGIKCWFHRPG